MVSGSLAICPSAKWLKFFGDWLNFSIGQSFGRTTTGRLMFYKSKLETSQVKLEHPELGLILETETLKRLSGASVKLFLVSM